MVDDADRENEGDIVFAASKATPELLAFTIRYGRGLICVPMLGPDLDRLNVPQMTSQNQEHHGTAFTISVDARHGITTGISAADRAKTIQLLASPASGPDDLVRPGHVFPLRYAEGGVLRRRGHTEAAVDLAVLAGLPPVGVVCEVIGDDGTMLRLPALREFADEHGLALISIEQLIEHRRRTERLVTRVARDGDPERLRRLAGLRLPLRHRRCRAPRPRPRRRRRGDGDADGGGRPGPRPLRVPDRRRLRLRSAATAAPSSTPPWPRSPSAAGASSSTCAATRAAGIGLLAKLQAYELQDAGVDTVDANLKLGLPVDAREYSVAAQLLDDLGVRSVRLLTNNPAKVDALAAHGFGVTRIPLPPLATPHNLRYLTTKRDRLGHQLDTLDKQGSCRRPRSPER